MPRSCGRWPTGAAVSPDGSRATTRSCCPRSRCRRFPLSEVDEASPVPGYLTRPGNYLGLCSLALPSGDSNGLPLGIQIVGKPYAEATVLRLGKAFQDATDFHKRAPDLKALGL